MGSITDDLLTGNIDQSQKDQELNITDDILSGGFKKGFAGDVPLGSVFTKERMGKQEEPAGMGTMLLSGFVDKPESKIVIYAKSRFPDDPNAMNRYGVHEGEIVYLDDDGKLYRETPDTWFNKVKRFAAETGAHLPTIVMSTIGAAGGPIPAMVGAMGGEGIRQTGGALLGEPRTQREAVTGMGKEAAFALGGEFTGKGIARGVGYLGAKRGGKLVAAAGRGRELIDPDKVQKLERLGTEFGIDLYPPQTTGSKALADKFKLLGDIESSAPIIQKARETQVGQIDDAVYKFLDEIAPPETTSLRAGEDIVEAAGKGLERIKGYRTRATKPFYTAARGEAAEVDVTDIVNSVDALIERSAAGSGSEKALRRVKTMLTKKGMIDEETEQIFNSFDILDSTKKEIDNIIKSPSIDWKTAVEKETKTKLLKIKNDLTSTVDEISQSYKKGRGLHQRLTPLVEQQKKGIAGQLTKLEGDKVVTASKKLFSSIESSPATVQRARRLIRNENPKAWDEALRVHLQDLFESTKQSATGDITNIGGHFYKKVWGNTRQKNILKAAMDHKQFQNIKNFMTLLKRSGLILGKEAATATREAMKEEIAGVNLKKVVRVIAHPMVTKKRVIGERILESALYGNAKQLAEAMVSEKAANQLRKMMKLPPSATKLLPQFTTFLTMVSKGAFSDDAGPETIPGVLRAPSQSRLMRPANQ